MQQVFEIESVESKPRATRDPWRSSRGWPYLKEGDRNILELVDRGMSYRLIGQLVGVNPGTVSRRIVLIKTRLQSPLARCALDPASPLPAEQRESTILHAVAGMSLREIARHRRLPLGAITDHVRFAQGVARATTSRRAASG